MHPDQAHDLPGRSGREVERKGRFSAGVAGGNYAAATAERVIGKGGYG